MPWHVQVHASSTFVELTFVGNTSSAELRSAAEETLALAQQHNLRLILADCQLLKGGHDVFDLYSLAKSIATEPVGPGLKEAIILPELPAAGNLVEFWQTTCYNQGMVVRAFGDRDDALAWLLAGHQREGHDAPTLPV